MALVAVSQAQGRVPVTVFQLQDRVNLGNFKELEQTARDAFDNGMRNLVVDMSETPSMTSIGRRPRRRLWHIIPSISLAPGTAPNIV